MGDGPFLLEVPNCELRRKELGLLSFIGPLKVHNFDDHGPGFMMDF